TEVRRLALWARAACGRRAVGSVDDSRRGQLAASSAGGRRAAAVQVWTGPVNIPAMELTFIGLSCLRLRGRDTEVLVDPLPQGAGRGPKLSPDIVVRTEGGTVPETPRPRTGPAQEVTG